MMCNFCRSTLTTTSAIRLWPQPQGAIPRTEDREHLQKIFKTLKRKPRIERIQPMSSLADELQFQRLLMLERRRCERTDGHFGLLLIHMDELKGTVSPVT